MANDFVIYDERGRVTLLHPALRKTVSPNEARDLACKLQQAADRAEESEANDAG